MSAHRRPGTREAAQPRRRATTVHRRRARGRPYRLLPVAVGVAIIGIGAMAGTAVVGSGWHPDGSGSDQDRTTHASLPDAAPEQGLIYEGLRPAGADSLCAGMYEIDAETCTHGPDAAPAGLRVREPVQPITPKAPEAAAPRREAEAVPPDAEIVRDEGGSALSAGEPALVPDAAPGEADFVMGNHDVACAGDGRTGKRVQVMYLHEFGTPSRYTDFLGSIRVWSAGADAIYDASAAETGGSRHIRYVTTPRCQVDVAEVQVAEGGLGTFRKSIDALQTLGYNRTDRKYLIFADTTVYCGIGTFIADRRPGLGNRNNGGPAYGRVDSGCWSSAMAAHELTHTLGALLRNSPNSTGAGGCTDDHDLLCGRDRSGAAVRTVCPKKHESRLDCGHDDYFSTDPKPGGFLAKSWNVAQSGFLLRSDGGDDVPDRGGITAPKATATPRATPTTPAPDPTPSTATEPGPEVTGGDESDGGGDARGRPERTVPAKPERAGPVEPERVEPERVEPPAAKPAKGAARAVDSAAAPAARAAPAVQAVLEVREPTSTSVRLMWSAAAREARYEVLVDGTPIATTVATRARLIGLRPDTAYQVSVRSVRGYTARAGAQTAPAARPAPDSWFVLTNSLTGGAAELYAARSANGTGIVLGGSDGDVQQQWKLVPGGGGTFSLQSRATGKCAVPLGGDPVSGAPLVQGDCSPGHRQQWTLQASDHGFTLRTTVGDLVAGVGSQRFGAHRLLVLQRGAGARHQSWTAVPG